MLMIDASGANSVAELEALLEMGNEMATFTKHENNEGELVSVGAKHPFFKYKQDSANAEFLNGSENILLIQLRNPRDFEIQSMKSGDIRLGCLYKDGVMLFVAKFYGEDAKNTVLDAPFDARKIKNLDMNNYRLATKESRLVINVHVIDHNSNVVALRAVTMPPKLTKEFLAATRKQLDCVENPAVMNDWMRQSTTKLASQCTMHRLGS